MKVVYCLHIIFRTVVLTGYSFHMLYTISHLFIYIMLATKVMNIKVQRHTNLTRRRV